LKTRVVAFMPVKNAEPWLPKTIEVLERFKEVARVVVSFETRSTDKSFLILRKWAESSPKQVEVYASPKPPHRVHTSAEIAFIYNDFRKILRDGDETHVLMWDSDVIDAPKNTVRRLLKHGKNIVAPYPYVKYHAPGKMFYDTFVYRLNGYRFHPFNPPRNNGEPLRLDSVGTAFLVERETLLETAYRDPYPHMQFCNDSREKGYEVWADPGIEIWHADLTRLGELHHALEYVPGSKYYNPGFKPPPFITDSGRVVEPEELYGDMVQLYVYGRLTRG